MFTPQKVIQGARTALDAAPSYEVYAQNDGTIYGYDLDESLGSIAPGFFYGAGIRWVKYTDTATVYFEVKLEGTRDKNFIGTVLPEDGQLFFPDADCQHSQGGGETIWSWGLTKTVTIPATWLDIGLNDVTIIR